MAPSLLIGLAGSRDATKRWRDAASRLPYLFEGELTEGIWRSLFNGDPGGGVALNAADVFYADTSAAIILGFAMPLSFDPALTVGARTVAARTSSRCRKKASVLSTDVPQIRGALGTPDRALPALKCRVRRSSSNIERGSFARAEARGSGCCRKRAIRRFAGGFAVVELY